MQEYSYNLAPLVPSSRKLEDALERLRPYRGITIIGLDNREIDSVELIRPGRSRHEIEIAMIQLGNKLKAPSTSPDDKAIALNNLACTYAWLSRYREAVYALRDAMEIAERTDIKRTAQRNLDVMRSII